jgi:hypothetical protein
LVSANLVSEYAQLISSHLGASILVVIGFLQTPNYAYEIIARMTAYYIQ